MNIGWVGLGSIGTNMVTQALGAGHKVTVFARGKGLALLFATNQRNAAELLKVAAAQGFATQEVASVIQACSGASYALPVAQHYLARPA